MSDSTIDQQDSRFSALPNPLRWLNARLQAERDRWLLWFPVGIGTGIALYFGAPVEPPAWIGPAAALLLAAAAWLAARTGWLRARLLALVLLSLTAGFAAAQIEAWRAAGPVLATRLGPVAFAGHVTNLEVLTEGQRITFAPTALGDLAPDRLPRLIRIRIATMADPPDAGDVVEGTAMLLPPAAPELPGAFDFQRQAYFMGLGGVGAAVGPIVVWRAAGTHGIGTWITRLRAGMTARIQAGLPGTPGGVASAIITGEKGAIDPNTEQDFRDAGLAHLLVIAGLHMTLVTGCAFFLLRGLLALVPAVALRYPIKKWAALAALVLACCYLVISGTAVPTQRAFTMCALALLAILYDRMTFSLFAIAWAATIVMLVQPIAITGGSFQMSFSAVICLIAFYESYGARLRRTSQHQGPLSGGLAHVIGIAVTTVVVTIGTTPYAIYHFSRFPVYSVLANVIAVPITAFWLMPWALVACLLMPVGLEKIGLMPMGWGIGFVQKVAHWTATLPGGIVVMPAMSMTALVAISLGGLWLALWLGRWRWWGAVPIVMGLGSLLVTPRPDILVADDGLLAAIHDGHRYWFTSSRGDKFAREIWMESDAGPETMLLPVEGEVALAAGKLACGDGLCRGILHGHDVALVYRQPKFAGTCPARVELLIVTARGHAPCPDTAGKTLDATRARQTGAEAIWLGRDITIETAASQRGIRPWVSAPMPVDG